MWKNSGAYVASLQEAPEMGGLTGFGPFENLRARRMIEPQIAAQHATPLYLAAMAGGLAEASGNGVLVPIADQFWCGQIESGIWQEIHRHMPMVLYRPTWLRDHEVIFRAVEERKPRSALPAMVHHLANIHDALIKTIGKGAPAPPPWGQRAAPAP